METLGEMIRTRREARGVRAADLAYQIGKDPSYLSKLERNLMKEVPDPAVVSAISAALGIPVVALLRAIGYAIPDGEGSAVTDFRLQEIVEAWPAMTPEAQRHVHSLLAVPGIVVREEPRVAAVAR
jgi:transcriptional regulator with XRE-family HTH domain